MYKVDDYWGPVVIDEKSLLMSMVDRSPTAVQVAATHYTLQIECRNAESGLWIGSCDLQSVQIREVNGAYEIRFFRLPGR